MNLGHSQLVQWKVLRLLVALLGFAWAAGPALAQFVYITNWTKTNNIYTNLNQQYPNTGVGAPGSGVGTPNASFLFDPTTYTSPSYIPGSNFATNGATFLLTSDANGRDFAEVNGGNMLVVPVNQNAFSVHLLMAAYVGTTFSATFTGADSTTETFSNIYLPDFNGGSLVNNSYTQNGALAPNLFQQSVFQVLSVGAGGTGNSSTGSYNYYNLVEISFNLSPQLTSQQLTSISITSDGYMTLLLGVTVNTVPEPNAAALLALGLPVLLVGLRRRARR